MTDTTTTRQLETDAAAPSLWHNRNFRRLLLGRLVTNAGDSLYLVAAMWLVFDLTGSSFFTGIAGFLTQFPRALQFLLGPLVDRWPLRGVLVVTQAIQAVVVLSIPVAAYTGTLTVWVVLAVIPVLATLNRFVYPAQSAALPRIVASERLARANSAFSFANNGTNMVFNAVGGVLIGVIGATSLYLVDSATFALAVLLFVGVRVPSGGRSTGADDSVVTGYVSDLTEGMACIRGTVFVKVILSAVVLNFTIGVTIATLPAFGAVRGGPDVYGALLAGLGGGMALGASATTLLEDVKYGHVRIAGSVIGLVTWLGAVYSPWVLLTVGLFALAWVPVGIGNVMWRTMIQRVTPDAFIGRVTSISSSAAMAALPVGSLVGGAIGDSLGSVTTMALTSVGFGVVALYFVSQPRLRTLPAMNDLDPGAFDVGIGSPSRPVDGE